MFVHETVQCETYTINKVIVVVTHMFHTVSTYIPYKTVNFVIHTSCSQRKNMVYAGELTDNRKRSVSFQSPSLKEAEAGTRLSYEPVNFVTHTGQL